MSVANTAITADEYMKQAAIKAEDGDYVAAVQCYDEVIRLDPTFARAYGNRGMVRANLGDRRGAIEDWRKAADLFLNQRSMANYEMVMSYLNKLQA